MVNFEQLIQFGLHQGADEVEIYLQQKKSDQIRIFQGKPESLLSSQAQGAGIRVFTDGQLGFVYTTNLSQEGMQVAITEAYNNARIMDTSEGRQLPEPAETYPTLDLYNPELAETDIQAKIQFAIDIEQAALAYDERITNVPSVSFSAHETKIQLVNSKGLNRSYQTSQVVIYLFAIAKEGEQTQDGLGVGIGRSLSELNAKRIGEEAAKEALSMLGGKPVLSQEVPVIFNSRTGAELFYPFVAGFVAEKVQKDKSLFKGKLNQQIANPLVTLIDDGLHPGGLRTVPFDGEGFPAEKTLVVEAGTLKNYLYDSHTAKKDGAQSTGNAYRANYNSAPEPAPTNLYLQPGDTTLEEMIAGVQDGFLALSLSGVHSGANAVSGDFSVGASGIWIKDGKLAQPVREITIAGNFSQFLMDIEAIGQDLEFSPLVVFMGSPSFKVAKLAISGS